jgi:hypothetical protein
MADIWRIYHVKNCRHTKPHKNKYVIIVCRDADYMGFLVNKEINQYTLKRPYLLECQVMLDKTDYGFLSQNSYLDCARIYPFKDEELMLGFELISDKTKADTKKAVAASKTIEKKYKSLILSNP